MKRFAAHYIFLSSGQVFKQHYIELDENNRLRGVFPLEKEIAETVFYNGILAPVEKEGRIALYFLNQTCWEGVDLLAAKLGADDSGSDAHVQRLC